MMISRGVEFGPRSRDCHSVDAFHPPRPDALGVRFHERPRGFTTGSLPDLLLRFGDRRSKLDANRNRQCGLLPCMLSRDATRHSSFRESGPRQRATTRLNLSFGGVYENGGEHETGGRTFKEDLLASLTYLKAFEDMPEPAIA